MEDVVHDKADITIYAISSPRLHVENAAEKLNAEDITCNIVHVFVLKPFEVTERLLAPLKSCGHGIVVDSSFEICGASRSIAYQLTQASGIPVRALALEDHTKCLCPPFQNKAPEAEDIYKAVRQLVKK
jgi:pyruvate/2-oxoglutarate/acetoin dehydrogenase E1 component